MFRTNLIGGLWYFFLIFEEDIVVAYDFKYFVSLFNSLNIMCLLLANLKEEGSATKFTIFDETPIPSIFTGDQHVTISKKKLSIWFGEVSQSGRWMDGGDD